MQDDLSPGFAAVDPCVVALLTCMPDMTNVRMAPAEEAAEVTVLDPNEAVGAARRLLASELVGEAGHHSRQEGPSLAIAQPLRLLVVVPEALRRTVQEAVGVLRDREVRGRPADLEEAA